MAKPLANGVPIGAILTSEKVGDLIKIGNIKQTMKKNTVFNFMISR